MPSLQLRRNERSSEQVTAAASERTRERRNWVFMRLTHPRGQVSVCVEIKSASLVVHEIKVNFRLSPQDKRMSNYSRKPYYIYYRLQNERREILNRMCSTKYART